MIPKKNFFPKSSQQSIFLGESSFIVFIYLQMKNREKVNLPSFQLSTQLIPTRPKIF